jgi:serine/threonine protein kinase
VEIGRVIEGRYVVERTLASGGMATVHVVRHTGLDSLHALKILRLPSPDIRERLLLEGRLQARLKHPNLVAVTDTLTIDGAPGLILELVEGPALDEWLADHRPSLDQAEAIFLGILAGVEHAHRHGVVHRDLKPANVLLAPHAGGFLPKVADFGIAKVVEDVLGEGGGRSRTRTGVAMGTPAYMAPEQIEGAKSLGPAADVFALGCILYDLVVGKPAFDGPSLLSILTASREGFYDDPADVVPDLPPRFVRAIRGALAPEVEDRIPDCATLARVLTEGRVGALASTGEVTERPDPATRPYPRGLGSNPRRSLDTFQPDDLPGRAPARSADPDVGAAAAAPPAAAPSPPPRAATGAPDPAPAAPREGGSSPRTPTSARPDGAASRLAPSTAEHVAEARERRRTWGLLALWAVLATFVVSLVVASVVLISVGVAGLAWWGVAATVPTAGGPDVPIVAPDAGPPDAPLTPSAPDPVATPVPSPDPALPPDAPLPVTPGPAPDPGPPKDPPPSPDPAPPVDPRPSPDPKPPTTGPTPTPRTDPDPVAPPEPPPAASGWALTVNEVARQAEVRNGVFRHAAPAGSTLLLLDVTVRNPTDREVEPKAPFQLRAGGRVYEAHGACRLGFAGSFSLVPELPARGTARGWVCFEVPADTGRGTLIFRPGGTEKPVEVRF